MSSNLDHNCTFELQINPFRHTNAFSCLYSKQLLENSVAKGEIAHDEQFLLYPQCFVTLFNKWSLIESFHSFERIFSNYSAADFL